MPFTPSDSHINAAMMLSGAFFHFADPLDFLAQQFGIDAKVDRQALGMNLAKPGGGPASMQTAFAEAPATNKSAQFRLQFFGRCEGKLIALCAVTYNRYQLTRKHLEEQALALVAQNPTNVLGVQLTPGTTPESLDPVEHADRVVRLLPTNVFNRGFFKSNIDSFEHDKKLKILEVGDAVLVELSKPWLYYDVVHAKRRPKAQNLLPFQHV